MDQIKEHRSPELFQMSMDIQTSMTGPILIVTGEASGDLHGANLVKAMRSKRSGLLFAGMGGCDGCRGR